MRTGMKIWIILASIVLFWGGVFCFVCCSDNLENRATDMAEKALRASVHNPESIRIMGISKPDSVFGHTYITQEEKMALSMAMVEINRMLSTSINGVRAFGKMRIARTYIPGAPRLEGRRDQRRART